MSELLTLPAESPATTAGDAVVPLERLEAQLCEFAGHLAAATARFLALVADFDARKGHESWSLPSTAAWLAWKCQLAPGTARDHVRVARALRALPVIRAEFAAGRLSYAKVRALTRIATPGAEAELAQMGVAMTAGQLDRFVRAHRRVCLADDQHARQTRRISWRTDDEGSLAMTVRLPAAEGQVVLQALRAAANDLEHPHRPHDSDAEDQENAGTPAVGSPHPDPAAADPAAPDAAEPAASGLADALTQLATDYLAGKIARAANPDIYQVIVHVGPDVLTTNPVQPATPGEDQPDVPAGTPSPGRQGPDGHVPAETRPGSDQVGVPAGTPPADSGHTRSGHASADAPGSGTGPEPCQDDCPYRRVGHPAHPQRCHIEDGPALSPAAAQRIACAATLTWMLHDHDGNLLDVGRRHRKPSPALRRAVRERDKGRCQFPGCHSRRTDIHHVRPWARGGQTRLRSLISLCEAHHVIVHELGYLITETEDGFSFTRPDGAPMPASPPPPPVTDDITSVHDAAITAATVDTSYYGDQFDLDLAIWATFANARIARERAAREHAGQEQPAA